MTIPKDDDIIRGLGFVTLYAGYLEEQIDELLFMLNPLELFPETEQRWMISRKVEKALRLVGQLEFETKAELLADLKRLEGLFNWRNEIIHGRIYGNFTRHDTLKSGRPNAPDREVTAAELYELAENLNAARTAILRPMVIKIPNALRGNSDG